ncbi:MAG: molybdopterin/thiamine biosynthesis adenylyltransferase [Parasphingorhabdus sp.]|jgi:molybdopterin/thiamine biosynthesis adenylyltransferase|uniref:HesA/MoeB/ThiF family protein n=1 Tax=Parasphingorhabdus sp. TaxID=2709688 RepID=UPI001B704286|nr:HesA/MoeB/ThiF family protein [Sphingomonadales bacterium]|tara:strand:- start:4545 stop:5327 length:783 start_codon:yes stop_codon:yes gene_type:complete
MSPLTDEQLDRYARHIVLKDIGGGGQKKILDAHILVVGAGGIGCPAIQYLAAAGIGALTIIDDDVVSLSNLQRQVLFSENDIGKAKVEVAKVAANRINPDIVINTINQRLTAQHFSGDAAAFFAAFDAIIDGTDNYQTRLLVSDLSVAHRVPLISAAIGQFQGQLGTFRGWEAGKPCYRCFVGDALDPDDCDNCSEVGVLGAMVGLMGSFAAMEAIRVVTGFGQDPAGKLQLFDGLAPSMRSINLPKDPHCKSCGSPPST